MDRFFSGGAAEVISFADDEMSAEMVPWDALRAAEATVKARYEDGVGAKGEGAGSARVENARTDKEERLASLRETIAARMRGRGMATARAECVVLTGRLEQSLELVVRRLVKLGDTVLVESPTGLVGLSVLERCGVQSIAVESDEQGVYVEALRELLEGAAMKPRLLCVAPTYGDPTGKVWSLERRQAVLLLCRKHGVSIVEDDSYGELKFHASAPDLPTLYELAGEEGGVLYVNSLEGTVAPTLQVGWIAGDQALVIGIGAEAGGEASYLVDGSDEAEAARGIVFNQLVLAELLLDFDLDTHVRRLAAAYLERMYAMQRQLRIYQIAGVKWSEPEGGKFIWLMLPDGLDAEALRRLTLMSGVDFTPGSWFYAGEAKRNTARLCFTGCSEEQIEQGIEIIAESIGDFVGRWSG